ncbi:MAG: helix-turn-helix domain-containing protein [SAR324 cluster bacterium]|nr:helix-turn-helix domain-containing protein [SAR324 cluster bacterium]
MSYIPGTLKQKDFALTLARGLSVLEAFSADRTAMSISEIAVQAGVHRAVARRLVLTLVELDYLENEGRKFQLTRKILNFGREIPALDYTWQKITVDVLSLANRFNESCSVATLEGLDIRFVIRDPIRRMFSAPLYVGDKLPAHCTAAGKVLLAALDKEQLRKRIADLGPLLPRTKHSIVEIEKLEKELQMVRQNSWAAVEDELEEGTIAIAVPLFDSSNTVTAALALGSHKMRRSLAELKQEFLTSMQNAAEQMSNHLADRNH